MATINSQGKLSAKKKGTTQITVTIVREEGLKRKFTTKVKVK